MQLYVYVFVYVYMCGSAVRNHCSAERGLFVIDLSTPEIHRMVLLQLDGHLSYVELVFRT